MTARLPFWAAFEEPAALGRATACSSSAQSQCGTSQPTYLPSLSGTRTLTSTREQDDQDADPERLTAIPPAVARGARTMTRMREEPDQDQCGLSASGLAVGTKTMTITETREEQDQDPPRHQILGLPRSMVGRV